MAYGHWKIASNLLAPTNLNSLMSWANLDMYLENYLISIAAHLRKQLCFLLHGTICSGRPDLHSTAGTAASVIKNTCNYFEIS